MDRQRKSLSKKNPHWIPDHRYLELKHFCLQYPEWKKLYSHISGLAKPEDLSPTEKEGMKASYYKSRMEMIENCCEEAAEDLAKYLLKGVTEGIGYNYLNVPCCKEVYYYIYRKFFWILSKARM